MERVHEVQGKFRYYLDILKLQVRYRWIATFLLACFYAIRAYLYRYVLLTFSLWMILSALVSFFLLSAIDPDDLPNRPVSSDAPPPILPVKASDELRPFVPFLPEFNFWCGVNVVLCVALGISFIPIPNLLCPWYFYLPLLPIWILCNVRILVEQREDMIKYKYIPFYYGDKKQGEYKGK